MDDMKIKVIINDPSGQDKFSTVTKNYLRMAEGFIIIFDVTNAESYDWVPGWISKISKLFLIMFA